MFSSEHEIGAPSILKCYHEVIVILRRIFVEVGLQPAPGLMQLLGRRSFPGHGCVSPPFMCPQFISLYIMIFHVFSIIFMYLRVRGDVMSCVNRKSKSATVPLRNWSSTSLWLRYFNHSGTVLAMDPVIDFLEHHSDSLKKDSPLYFALVLAKREQISDKEPCNDAACI